jgi:T5SS/PEP-CTERM-associated repeat protein
MSHPHRPSALPGLALAALLLAPSVARADVTFVDRSAFLGAASLQDGEFDAPPIVQEAGFPSFDRSLTSQIGDERAVVSARATLVQGVDSASISASGSVLIQHGSIDEGRGASGESGVSFLVCVDERSTFTVNVQGNVQANAVDSTLVQADVCCDSSGAPVTLEAGDGTLPRSLTLPIRSGVIAASQGEDCVSVAVRASSNLGNGGPDTNLPTSRATWSLSLDVVSSPEAPEASEVFLWVGGSSGAFGNPQNWDPVGAATEGVPTFVEGVRRDAAVVLATSSVTIDLAGGAAAAGLSRGPRGPIVQSKMGRLEVPLTPSFEPVGGTLTLDSLDLDILGMVNSKRGRSLEIGNNGLLRVDDARVVARHVAVGSGSDGSLVVEGPGGGFTTLGRFGLGANGDGKVDITKGAIVDTAETVLGELNGKGSARITGQGTLWRTGNIAVGYADDASLTIEGGALVESESAFVDCPTVVATSASGETFGCPGLEGDERAKVTVSGGSVGSDPSVWRPDKRLVIGPLGSLAIVDLGAVIAQEAPDVALELSIGGGSAADCGTAAGEGRACVTVREGSLVAKRIVVGSKGHGVLDVSPGAVIASDLEIADDVGSLGSVRISGGATSLIVDNQLQISNSGGHGELRIEDGATAQAGGLAVGTSLLGARGRILVFGRAADPGATSLILKAGSPGAAQLGFDSSELPAQVVQETGEIELVDGEVKLDGKDLVIARRGLVDGDGEITGTGRVFNGGLIRCGIVVRTGLVQRATGRLECPAATLAPAPQLNPLAASRFARALRRPAPPPAPPPGPFVVDGDAELDGLLVLQFLNGFAPRAGDSFDLLDVSGSVTGSFADVLVRGLAPGTAPAEDFVAGKLSLTFPEARVALPTVSFKAKPTLKLKETKKKGRKVKVVRRGDTSAPLLVAYTIDGTAQNGIDYEPLAGTLEIPAGKKSAKIVLRPRADALAEGPETIELELVPGDDYAPSLFSKVTIEVVEKRKK